MEEIGKVVKCAHCNGNGRCNCNGCQKKAGIGGYVVCSSCGGSGQVWVGPQTVQIIQK